MPVDFQTLVQMRNNQLLAQYQHQLQQYKLFLQQNLLVTMQTPPFVPSHVSVTAPNAYAPPSMPSYPAGSDTRMRNN